jgi:hypothetical protein
MYQFIEHSASESESNAESVGLVSCESRDKLLSKRVNPIEVLQQKSQVLPSRDTKLPKLLDHLSFLPRFKSVQLLYSWKA